MKEPQPEAKKPNVSFNDSKLDPQMESISTNETTLGEQEKAKKKKKNKKKNKQGTTGEQPNEVPEEIEAEKATENVLEVPLENEANVKTDVQLSKSQKKKLKKKARNQPLHEVIEKVENELYSMSIEAEYFMNQKDPNDLIANFREMFAYDRSPFTPKVYIPGLFPREEALFDELAGNGQNDKVKVQVTKNDDDYVDDDYEDIRSKNKKRKKKKKKRTLNLVEEDESPEFIDPLTLAGGVHHTYAVDNLSEIDLVNV